MFVGRPLAFLGRLFAGFLVMAALGAVLALGVTAIAVRHKQLAKADADHHQQATDRIDELARAVNALEAQVSQIDQLEKRIFELEHPKKPRVDVGNATPRFEPGLVIRCDSGCGQ